MKKILFILSMLLMIISCKTNNQGKVNNQTFVAPRKDMKVLLDSFVHEYGDKEPLYEIYIDKLEPWNYDIIIYSGKESLSEDNCAIIYTMASGVKFDVYTGLEHYFGNIDVEIDDGPRLSRIPDGNYWVVTDSSSVQTIKEVPWEQPFLSLPWSRKIEYLPPIIIEE